MLASVSTMNGLPNFGGARRRRMFLFILLSIFFISEQLLLVLGIFYIIYLTVLF
uniref:Uncharacterized protein n=1 Tax=Meloidogyne enterolobii TaxID=390850 RepID=A0A6V7ULY7_MELEN|nr:unnamed protein product [Meloidogyne enterolobii]